MTSRLVLAIALATGFAACSTQGKKPRLPEGLVVGTWMSDTMRASGAARLYSLQINRGGMAEFTSETIGRNATTERGTWDGADSLVRVFVRSESSTARPTSILLAIRGKTLGLVEYDTAAWGPRGLTLYRR